MLPQIAGEMTQHQQRHAVRGELLEPRTAR